MGKPYYEDEPEKPKRPFVPRHMHPMTQEEYSLREGFKEDLKRGVTELPANIAGLFTKKDRGKGAIRGAIKKLMQEQFGGG